MVTELERLRALLKQKRSKSFYAEKLGITTEEVEELLKELRKDDTEEVNFQETWVEHKRTENASLHHLVEEKLEDEGNSMNIKGLWDEKPSSPEEIIEMHKIDINKWKLNSYWSKWNGTKWLVSAFFMLRKADTDLEVQKSLIIRELFENSPKTAWTIDFSKLGNKLLEISIFDPHFGKLAWAEETGDDYDIDIAEARFIEAITGLLSRVNLTQVERIHLPIGNDLFNVDTETGTTTAGTPQDCDSRFAKMVKRVKNVVIKSIDKLSSIAPVDVTIVSGNHDSTTSFMLGEILEAFYHNNENVNINNSPKWRKFYQFGNNGFMYTHGNNEKHSELGIIFATEMPELWADTKYRFVKLGHFHKNKTTEYITVDDKLGVQVQILPSLSGTDEWHYSKGYLSNKQAKAFLYDKVEGEIATYTYNAKV